MSANPRAAKNRLTAFRRSFHCSHSRPESSGPDVVPVITSTTKPVASLEETVIMSLTARMSSGVSLTFPASLRDS